MSLWTSENGRPIICAGEDWLSHVILIPQPITRANPKRRTLENNLNQEFPHFASLTRPAASSNPTTISQWVLVTIRGREEERVASDPICLFAEMSNQNKGKKGRSAIADVVTREYTINLHKRVCWNQSYHINFPLPSIFSPACGHGSRLRRKWSRYPDSQSLTDSNVTHVQSGRPYITQTGKKKKREKEKLVWWSPSMAAAGKKRKIYLTYFMASGRKTNWIFLSSSK